MILSYYHDFYGSSVVEESSSNDVDGNYITE